MKSVSPKGVLLGTLAVVVVDVLGSAILSAFMVPVGVDPQGGLEALEMNPWYRLASFGLGTLSTALGGYIAARLARARHYLNAAAVGGIHIVLGLLLSAEYPVWLVIPAALLGGHVAKWRDSLRVEQAGTEMSR